MRALRELPPGAPLEEHPHQEVQRKARGSVQGALLSFCIKLIPFLSVVGGAAGEGEASTAQ